MKPKHVDVTLRLAHSLRFLIDIFVVSTRRRSISVLMEVILSKLSRKKTSLFTVWVLNGLLVVAQSLKTCRCSLSQLIQLAVYHFEWLCCLYTLCHHFQQIRRLSLIFVGVMHLCFFSLWPPSLPLKWNYTVRIMDVKTHVTAARIDGAIQHCPNISHWSYQTNVFY